jgi:hypothetical protein
MLKHASINDDSISIDQQTTSFVSLIARVIGVDIQEKVYFSIADDTDIPLKVQFFKVGNALP